jgi:hypothetical protein
MMAGLQRTPAEVGPGVNGHLSEPRSQAATLEGFAWHALVLAADRQQRRRTWPITVPSCAVLTALQVAW